MKIEVEGLPPIETAFSPGQSVQFRCMLAAHAASTDEKKPAVAVFTVVGLNINLHPGGFGVSYRVRNVGQHSYGSAYSPSDLVASDLELAMAPSVPITRVDMPTAPVMRAG